MRRREFVWMIAGVAVAPVSMIGQQQAANPLPPPVAPVPWTLGLNAATPIPVTRNEDTVAQTEPSFFSATQFATLVRLSALMMPSLSGKPGALDAEAPAFLDFIIGDSSAPRKLLYTRGLAWLDAESQGKHGVPFADATDAQADAIVKPWLRTWMTDHPPTEAHADFVNIAHADIRMATVNSKAWHDALARTGDEDEGLQMYWSPIDPDESSQGFHDGIHGRPSPNAPAAEHTTQSYPSQSNLQ